MSENTIQTNFSFGELSPSMFARVDEKMYRLGLATCRNFFVDFRSGVSTRQGTKFIAGANDPTHNVVLREFQITPTQGYILEIGHQYIRMYKNGVSIFTLATGYQSADLYQLKLAQFQSTMTITHVNYPPRVLTYIADNNWTIADIVFGPTIGATSSIVLSPFAPTPAAGVSVSCLYGVTGVDVNGQEGPLATQSQFGSPPSAPNIPNTDLSQLSINISWNAIPGAVSYNVYKAAPSYGPTRGTPSNFGALGYIGSTTQLSTVDTYSKSEAQVPPNYAITPPLIQNPFASNNPGVCGYWDQRAVFGGSLANPQTVWMSVPGTFVNFNISNPAQQDDAITATMVTQRKSTVKHFVPFPRGLLVFTDTGVHQEAGDAVTFTDEAQAYTGAADPIPLTINRNILYVQAKGAKVRNLTYNFYANIFTGDDVGAFSNHLMFGHQIIQWAFAEEPFSTIWAVRDDGALLSLGYIRDDMQTLTGWAVHDTGANGTFLSVATCTEGTTDAVYFVVQRLVGGVFQKYIERMADRVFPNGIVDSWSLDSATQQTSGVAFTIVTGLGYLNGLVVNACADGVAVIGLTVSGGQVTLPNPAFKATVGIPFTAQLQTLPLEPGEPTIQGKRKIVPAVTLKVKESRGLSVGRSFTTLVPIVESGPPILSSSGLFTGDERATLDPYSEVLGQVCVQQTNPFPATVLGVVPEYDVGDSWK